ncbi:M23 family metallopeptidase [Thermoflexus sp.]|uniref:M23 family metallopeptidase n=1 Tax=Thermoflexus sp. TaxID=1969742 RepID=UPI0035E464E3
MKPMLRYHWWMNIAIGGFALLITGAFADPSLSASSSQVPPPTSSQALQERPFGLPFAEPPGPSTWLMVQPYGNTVGAFRQRNTTYRAGQGLHFGIDLAARCGTPIVAIGDGVVSEVDAAFHGAGPHNLMIDHPNGYASFYGHLLERPALSPGQPVRRGQVIAKVGDPDGTCRSRPHLHLEIRDAPAHRRAYNPVLLIEADWDSLALVGGFSRGFQRDLTDPRRWQFLEDQPEVIFGGPLLNDFAVPWPPEWRAP